MSEEQTLDTTQLEASLNDLVKAAGTLSKGGVENSGTYSDGKPAGGGQGSMSDAGSVDDLMIAKMTAAGIDAGTIANFKAFMEQGDEEDEDEDEDMSGKMAAPPQPPFKKSLDQFRDDPEIEKAIDVSPFLEALTTRTADQLDNIRKSHMQVARQQGDVNQKLAAALHQIGKLVKSQAVVIDELGKRLNLVERTPAAAPKGVTGTAKPLQKALGAPTQPGGEPLTKSEILATLSYMNLEKGMRQINGQSTTEIVGLFNGGNVIAPETVAAVQSFLANNPNEAAQAKTYR